MTSSRDTSFPFADLSFSSLTSEPASSDTGTPQSTAELLTERLAPYSGKLSVAHLNTRSMRPPSKFPEFTNIILGSGLDIICVTESWLDPSISNAEVSLLGYRMIRHDRVGKGGGGIAIYLNNTFNYNVLASSPPQYIASAEFLIIEVVIVSSKILLAVVYHPPRAGSLDQFEEALEFHLPNYEHKLIMGDFNVDLSTTNPASTNLRTTFSSLNLHILPTDATHHEAHSHSLLDLMVVGDEGRVLSHGQLPVGSSDHDLIYLVLSLFPPKPTPKLITCRNFKNFEANLFLDDARSADWNFVYSAPDIDSKVLTFNNIVTSLFDKHAPFRTFIAKHQPVPWMTPELKHLINRRDEASRKFAQSKSSREHQSFTRARNKAKQAIRNAKLRYAHCLFPPRQTQDEFYKNVKKILPKTKDCDILLSPDELVESFSSVPQPPQSIIDTASSHYSALPIRDGINFEIQEFTEANLLKNLKKGNQSSMGYDQIPLNYLTRMSGIIAPVILHIFNTSVQTKTFPEIWKKALIRPIPKTKNPSSASDYRPISLLCSLSKVLERLIHQQVTSHINRHNLLNPFQSGFRTGHSTCSALLKVSDDIQAAMDKTMATILILFDFSKAFDLVSHRILLQKLRTFGLDQNAIAWFESYLSGRSQCVLGSNTDRSGWKPVLSGVPQGSVLGPLLFSLFINDISSCFNGCHYHLYADDLQVYLSFRPADLPLSVHLINTEIQLLVTWAKSQALIINPQKTKVLFICSPGVRRTIPLPIPPIEVDGNRVEVVDSARNLGIIFDNALSWVDEVPRIRKNVFGTLWTLKRIKNFTSQNSKIKLVKSFILPKFEYCAPLLHGLTLELSTSLQRAQNSCVRFIYNVRRREHITPYYNRLQWLRIEDRRRILTLSVLYKLLKSRSPPYLYEKYQFRTDVSSRDTRSHELLLDKPRHHTQSYSNAFLLSSIDLWNALPLPILNSLSFFSFKTLLDKAVSEGLFNRP
ncbi:hypothetical protein M8J77_005490 [Diaphorina citri]|nr:hypothetical protein M8J77_005490 [Diaphorina citri]